MGNCTSKTNPSTTVVVVTTAPPTGSHTTERTDGIITTGDDALIDSYYYEDCDDESDYDDDNDDNGTASGDDHDELMIEAVRMCRGNDVAENLRSQQQQQPVQNRKRSWYHQQVVWITPTTVSEAKNVHWKKQRMNRPTRLLKTILDQDDLLSHILPYVDIKSVASYQRVNKRWRRIVRIALDKQTVKVKFQTQRQLRQAVCIYCRKSDTLSSPSAFYEVICLYGSKIGMWDVSLVTDFSSIFSGIKDFDENIESWDVGNAIQMCFMFHNAQSFDQPLNRWNTSRVMNMTGMFVGALSFNRPLDKWDTSRVMNMAGMFCGARSFNHPIKCWNTRNVKFLTRMFCRAKSFYQDLSGWDTSSVETMVHLFDKGSQYEQLLVDVLLVENDNITINDQEEPLELRSLADALHTLWGWDTSSVQHRVCLSKLFHKPKANP